MPVSRPLVALRFTGRSMVWGPLTGAAAALAGIVVAVRPWDGHPLSLSVVRVAFALSAAAAAFAVDDDAAVTLSASPTSLGRRRTTRLALIAAGGTGVAVGACLAVAALGGTDDLPLARLLLEATGMQLLAVAFALLVGGDRGACVFAGSLLSALVVQVRFPSYALFPFAPGGPGWERARITWLAIACTAAVIVIALSRDPATRRYTI